MNARKNNKEKDSTKVRHLVIMASVVAAVAVGMVLLAGMSKPNASTLPKIRDVFTLYNTYNMTVVVVFDEEPPVIQFITPDGSMVEMETLRYRTGSNFIQYFLPNAMPGVWQMAYDPLSNYEIATPYSVYMEHIFISDFTSDTPQGNYEGLPLSFEVSADNGGEFVYVIHAVFTDADNNIAYEIVVGSGRGELNDMHSIELDTQPIRNMGGFMLRLTVSVQHGQAAIRDSAWLDLRL